ncbi:leucine-rich repeat-containing protein 14-like [Catharus ustulatus]|uniref:leucine-rich repeat-containing protein 14-like n=1 Tax=Catharus ustulatus TaxID=91951 RepID=UPI00140BBE2A|nr:leucine-rich repeat-containing protein 14-like [Catharus ustulatus]
MDSLVFLCVHEVVTQRPLPDIPPHLYPVIFELTFLAGILPVLQDLVATWPFPVLKFQRPVGQWEDLWVDRCCDCIQAIIQAVVDQLRRELEEPGSDSSGCRLRMLDMTGIPDDADSRRIWSCTEVLAKACVEVSKHQQEFQRHRTSGHTGVSGAMTAAASPQLRGVDVHADVVVDGTSYQILHDALQTGAAGPLRLKCRELQALCLSASQIVTLLESLDPSWLHRVNLYFINLGLTELSVILPHLTRFPELRSLKLWNITMDVQHPTPESANRLRCVARQLGMLPSLQELNLRSARLPGNLCHILCDLQAPLESLNLGYCSLIPDDLTFLSQSIHAPALKSLDLSGLNVSQGLLEQLQLLLEKASASLLYLDLSYCHIADSHLAVLLPTLLCCSRLRFLGLEGNPLSTAAIKDLLQKTLELPNLHLVVYPVPLDCHTLDPSEFDSDFFYESVDEELFLAAKAEIFQLLENSGRTDLVWTDKLESLEDLDDSL